VDQCKYHEHCALEGVAISPGDEPLCILHSRDPNKDRSRFESAFSNHKKHRQYDYSYIAFPDRFDIRRVFESGRVDRLLNFTGALFYAEVRFREVAIDAINFMEAEFRAESDFEGIKIEQTTSFYKARFGKHANFKGAVFQGWANFDDAVFEGDVCDWGAIGVRPEY